jgi:hypothetical protein
MVEKSDSKTDPSELLALTTDIVASHVANNTVAVADLSSLFSRFTRPWPVSRQRVAWRNGPTRPCRLNDRSLPIMLFVWKTAKN